MTTTKKQEKKPDSLCEKKSLANSQETVVLKNDTIIEGVLHKAGTQIEATAEIKELLRPFGYCESNRESGHFIRKDS